MVNCCQFPVLLYCLYRLDAAAVTWRVYWPLRPGSYMPAGVYVAQPVHGSQWCTLVTFECTYRLQPVLHVVRCMFSPVAQLPPHDVLSARCGMSCVCYPPREAFPCQISQLWKIRGVSCLPSAFLCWLPAVLITRDCGRSTSMAAAGTTNADDVLHVRVILCASSSHTDKVMHYGTAGNGIVMRG